MFSHVADVQQHLIVGTFELKAVDVQLERNINLSLSFGMFEKVEGFHQKSQLSDDLQGLPCKNKNSEYLHALKSSNFARRLIVRYRKNARKFSTAKWDEGLWDLARPKRVHYYIIDKVEDFENAWPCFPDTKD